MNVRGLVHFLLNVTSPADLADVRLDGPIVVSVAGAPSSSTAPPEVGPGDVVFCFGKGVVSWGIRSAERFHREWERATTRDGMQFDHVAIIEKALPNGDWTLIQALPHGVATDTAEVISRLSQYEGYCVIKCPGDRERTVEFARSQVGYRYGFVTVVSFIITLFSPRFFNVMLPRTWICSALAGESLRFGGWLHDWPDIYQVTPAQLWRALESVVDHR